ncbi:SidA/IucD/PvdA family monooxygenase [Gordonia sp. SID5947]|uniref:SidA/IucD/PvdA family monooxygenase n=1 Tax=Gordonia sp. SID5947 TaxID=2690315 RepID=UPI00136E8801|nr:SidA/IucD/PvdA family monooxygenase [Gordonia sp. SID5947]MYR07117.1 SidA/IucD/PvdA family monooxygenase [Gordonia sp. SID5947]
MSGRHPETMIIVGAGPKALAVAAKAKVMRDLGLPAPVVRVVEAHAVGANWQSIGGWTDGRHRLGTSPEKDIGFPYRSAVAGRGDGSLNAEISRRMLDYSWMSFLVEHQTYAEWVDRGRPNPHHNVWARYLQWVANRVELDVTIGTVRSISADEDQWSLDVVGADGRTTEMVGDGLMLTGPGSSDSAMIDDERVLSVSSFWDLVSRRGLPVASRAAVIGGGETAGSALDELVRHEVMTVSVISPGATIYTRGESYFENAMFSDPTGWSNLSPEERRDVIRRTDRGVFSVTVQENLLGDNRVHHLQGRVVSARRTDDLIAVTLHNPGRPAQTHTFDLVVDATGGQPLWFLDLFTEDAADLLELTLGWPPTLERIESSIGHDLAVTGLSPTLYLPNLAGFAQGPGFPNLSCLGEVSNRILRIATRQRRRGARDHRVDEAH